MFKIGDRVKWTPVHENPQDDIRAFRDMRGVVVAVRGDGQVRIHWRGDMAAESFFRPAAHVMLAEVTP
jgi:hypothetical protein